MTCFISVMPWRSGVSLPANSQRIHVEVLSIPVDPLFTEHCIDVPDEPLPGVGVAQVQEVSAEYPIRMLFRQPALAVPHPFRLEPDDKFLPLLMHPIAKRAKGVGITICVNFPRAGIRPVALARIPTGVAPAQIHRDVCALKFLHGVKQIFFAAFDKSR